MKKIGFFLCLLVITLSSCDPGCNIDYKLINNSGHSVVFASKTQFQYFWEKHPNGIMIKQGEDSLFYTTFGRGDAEFDYAKGALFYYQVYGDTITFTFDDGKRLIYTQEEGNGPFDFEGNQYTWITKRGHMFLKYYDQYGCLTYTITEEDYANSIEP